MNITRYHQKRTLCLSRMYVCGNLHRFVIELREMDGGGQWPPCYKWFDSMSEAVVWVVSEGIVIDNWEECKEMLEMEEECRIAWDEWMRGEMVRQILPPVPMMIVLDA